ncbi:YggT family protein [Pasteurella bettyae]|uniref:YGGT family protein n=1 Tax=Pasteurella bettyae CCUG 2042 TaxID=1095749 RepID=I3DJG1_9PAST|nr:YggT family protein [Pasteurella bettyae]EIJ71854.1 YGGT family protein [Pasteurella bettyae CCUG 2042]SUB22368.1 putative transmembrane protein [Pasteurella bettyae]
MSSISFLVNTVISLYMLILMLRMWFQYCKVDFYNPLSQTIVKITNPVLNPLRKLLPSVKNIDLAAIFFVFILGFIKVPLLYLANGQWAIEILQQEFLQYLLIGILSVFSSFGKMIFYVIFLGAILSWFNRGNNQLNYLLYQLGEPVLSPIRKVLPRTGMIDFSAMILAFGLFFVDKFLYDIFGIIWQLAS